MKVYVFMVFFLFSSIFSSVVPSAFAKETKLKTYDFTKDEAIIKQYNPRAPLWVPLLETVGSNLALGAFNKYVTKSDFAQISFSSIEENFKAGWGWDADNFFTNMWGHPFQGSVYYNTARSSGYNFWVSMLVTAFGSLQWEYFMEIEHPSINDLVMTTLQGAIFGEVFYRISSLMLDETTKDKRVWRELGVMGFNPARSLNRVIYGRSFRLIQEQLYPLKPYRFNLLFGINNHSRSEFYEKQKRRGFLGIKYLYGDIFRQKEFQPLDMFHLDLELQAKPSLSLVRFKIMGVLWARAILLKKEPRALDSKLILGFFTATDYYKNDVFNIGAVHLGVGAHYISPRFLQTRFIASSVLYFMPMAGVNSNYASLFIPEHFEEGRDYNLSSGLSAKTQFRFIFRRFIMLGFSHSFWVFATLQGAQGKEFVHIFEPSLAVHLHRYVKLGFELLYYRRSGKYMDFENITLTDIESRLSLVISY